MNLDEPMPEIAQADSALSLDGAAALITKSMQQESVPRAADGKFAAREQPAEKPETEDSKVVDLKTGKPVEEIAKVAAAEEDDDPEVEIAAEEEGKEARKVKLTELVEGYERAAKLSAEIEEHKATAARVPAEYQSALADIVQTRSNYLQGLDVVRRMINPRAPNTVMLDPNSEHYNPDGYRDLHNRFENDKQLAQKVLQDIDYHTKKQAADEKVLADAAWAGQLEALARVWPDSKKAGALEALSKGLADDYGFTKEEINNISDHRQLLVVRDALELRALKAKQADAVKVVRAKPKLVKGTARTTTDPRAAAQSASMSRLQATGSVDAAAEFIKTLMK